MRGDKARSRWPVILPALPPPCYQGARQRSFAPGDRMRPNNGAIKIVAGNSNPPLADAIAAYLATPLTKAVVRRFADMEIFVEIQENVRGTDVFVIQSTSYPANDNLMELLIIIDALRRASGPRGGAAPPRVLSFFRLRAAGPNPGAAHADLGQARVQPDHPRRRRPGDDARSARRADPRLLRHPDRQFVRRADDGARHQGALRYRQGDGGFTRRRRGRPRPRPRQAD